MDVLVEKGGKVLEDFMGYTKRAQAIAENFSEDEALLFMLSCNHTSITATRLTD